MAITLAFVEATAVFGAAYTTLVLWAHPLIADWTEAPGLLGQAAALSLSCLAAFYDNALYDVRTMRSPAQFVSRLPKSFCIALLLIMCGAAWFPRIRISVAPLIASLFAIFGTVLLCRAAAYGVTLRYPFTKRVLVLGATSLAQSLIRELEAQPRCTVVGVVDDAMPTGWPQPSHPLLGPLRQLDKLVEAVRPDRIIVALTERRGQLPGHQLLASRVKGIVVEDGLEVYERLTGKLAIESLTSSNLIFSKD